MAFQTLGVANSPLGRLISQGFDRRNQQQMQADSQAFQGGQNSLQRGNLRRMQDDRQKFEKEMDVLQYGRGKIQRERDKTTFENEQEVFGNQQAQFTQSQGDRIKTQSSNQLNDYIGGGIGEYISSLYDAEGDAFTFDENDNLTLSDNVSSFLGMTDADFLSGDKSFPTFLKNKYPDLNEEQLQELGGKSLTTIMGQIPQMRQGALQEFSSDMLQDFINSGSELSAAEMSEKYEGLASQKTGSINWGQGANPWDPSGELLYTPEVDKPEENKPSFWGKVQGNLGSRVGVMQDYYNRLK